MAIETLLETLEEDAAAERRELIERAHREAAELTREARADRGERLSRAIDAHRAEVRERAEAETAEAARRAERDVLEARDRMLERVREATGRAADRLLDGPRGRALLARLAAEVAPYVGDAQATLRCRPEDAEAVSELVREESNLRVAADADAAAGIRCETDEGRTVVDVTLPALLDRAWRWLRIEAVRRSDEESDR